MPRATRMVAGMLIRRIVAAPDLPARRAEPKVHPGVTVGETIDAASGGHRSHRDHRQFGAELLSSEECHGTNLLILREYDPKHCPAFDRLD